MPSFSKRSGFTLVELLICIAIVGILSVITFAGFSQERKKSSVRRAAEQLQVDLQGAQAQAQSAVIYKGVMLCTGSGNDGKQCANDTECNISSGGASCTGTGVATCGTCGYRAPLAYGIRLTRTPNDQYLNCLEIDQDGPGAAHPNGYCDDTNETLTTKLLESGTQFAFVFTPSCTVGTCEPHILFSVPSGQTTIRNAGSAQLYTQVEVRIKNVQTGLCYSVIVQANSGTVSRRQFTSGC